MANRKVQGDDSQAMRPEREPKEDQGEFAAHPQQVPDRMKPASAAEERAASTKVTGDEASYARADEFPFSAANLRERAEEYADLANADLPHEIDAIKFMLKQVESALESAAQTLEAFDQTKRGPEPVVTNWDADRYEPKSKK